MLFSLAWINVLSNERAKVKMLQELFAAKDAAVAAQEKKRRQLAEAKLNAEQNVVR